MPDNQLETILSSSTPISSTGSQFGNDSYDSQWYRGYGAGTGWNTAGYILPSNNAKSAEALRADLRQMTMQDYAQRFNSAEAQKSRDWSEMMSNTEIQRRVADLQAAGFSPLAALAGVSGASTPSAAVAHGSPGNSHSSSPGSEGFKMLAQIVGMIVTKGISTAMVAQEMQTKAAVAQEIANAKIASSEKIAAAKLGKSLDLDVGKAAFQNISKEAAKSSNSALNVRDLVNAIHDRASVKRLDYLPKDLWDMFYEDK